MQQLFKTNQKVTNLHPPTLNKVSDLKKTRLFFSKVFTFLRWVFLVDTLPEISCFECSAASPK